MIFLVNFIDDGATPNELGVAHIDQIAALDSVRIYFFVL